MEVLVTSASFGKWSAAPARILRDAGITIRYPRVPGPLRSEQLQEEVGDADAIIAALDDFDAAAVRSGCRLKIIAKHGVGVDNIDISAAAERGIVVTNAPHSNSSAVADLVFGLLLAGARSIVPAHASVIDGRWETFPGVELTGKTIGIVGLGSIGREVAARARGFSMHVIGYDPYALDSSFDEEQVERCSTLDSLLERSQVVTLHLPGGQGKAVIGARELGLLPSGALLINAARGDLVDELAIATVLRDGRLRAYMADAFAEEPPLSSPLLTAPNVVLTPHIGAFTDRANELMGTMVARDVVAVLNGFSPAHPVQVPTTIRTTN